LTGVRSSLTTFRDAIFWPAVAACLSWPRGFALLNSIAARDDVLSESTAVAIAGAACVAPVADERDWKRRYRLTRLVDHCDLFLMRTRSRNWFERHVDVEGEWPACGPFIAMTFHWGAGLWALARMHDSGVPVRFLAARVEKEQLRGDPFAARYARWRLSTVERAGGAPVIYTGGATAAIQKALANGQAVVALYDIPAVTTNRTLRTTVCGRPVALPAGMANLAVESGVPVVAFEMGLDYRTGRRQLRIQPSFISASAQDFADRLAVSLTRLLATDTAAWHFSGLAPQFFGAHEMAATPLAESS
jgi:hypothetical protein